MQSRIRAAVIHLFGSALLILGTTGLFLLHFYPGILAELMDVTDLLEILIPVDIVLGPLLTFLIYRPGKKGLKLDIAIIIFFQLAALAYGNWNLLKSRPGFLVFYYDSFFIASPRIPQTIIDPSLFVGPLDSPQSVWIDMSQLSFAEKIQVAQDAMQTGIPVQFESRFFRPLNTIESKELETRSIKDSAIPKLGLPKAITEKLEYLKSSGHKLGYFSLVYGQSNKIVVVDTEKKIPLMSFDIPRHSKAKSMPGK